LRPLFVIIFYKIRLLQQYFFGKVRFYKISYLSVRDLLEIGSLWKDKLQRIKQTDGILYLALGDNKERGKANDWGWKVYARNVNLLSLRGF